jgi:hypothetical protein
MAHLASKKRRKLESFPARMLGRPRARLGNPNTGIPELLRQALYDIYFVAPSNTFPKLTLFSIAQGGAYASGGVTSFTKGQGHTNILQPGMLQSSYSFIARAGSVYVQGQQGTTHPILHPEDLENLLGSFLQFQINTKSYFDGIVAEWPAAGGQFLSGFGTLTAAASEYRTMNGLPQTHNRYAFPGGQFINPQETFAVVIDPTQNALTAGGNGAPSTLATGGNPTGVSANGIGAWVIIDGTLVRVAQ